MAGALGALLVAGSASAATTVVLHGKGDLVSQPLTGDLQVVDARLEPLLVPGRSSDLILTVRNRSAYILAADRVTLQLPVRDERPAGCVAKVSGPLLSRAGVTLDDAQRTGFAPGGTAQVVVPDALRLAAGAKGGCGFRVVVDVQAVRVVPPGTPSPSLPTTRPTPTRPTPQTPTAPPSTSPVPTPPPTDPTPPSMPPVDCDPADPGCN